MGYQSAPEGWWQSFVSAQPARTGKLALVRVDGSPHVAPVWVDLDGDEIVLMTSADTIKGPARSIPSCQMTPRAQIALIGNADGDLAGHAV